MGLVNHMLVIAGWQSRLAPLLLLWHLLRSFWPFWLSRCHVQQFVGVVAAHLLALLPDNICDLLGHQTASIL